MKKILTILFIFISCFSFSQESKERYNIFNSLGFKVATVVVINNDIQEVYDYKGIYLGRYIQRMNITYDSTNAVFGKGNLINSLINR